MIVAGSPLGHTVSGVSVNVIVVTVPTSEESVEATSTSKVVEDGWLRVTQLTDGLTFF